MSTLVRESKYIKSDFDKNNNKFWYIRELDDSSVEVEWGRVGKTSQSKTKSFSSQYGATNFFDKKCSEKERSGRNGEIAYRKLNVIGNSGSEVSTSVVAKNDIKNVALRQISHSSSETKKLIEYLIKVNVHNIMNSTTMTYNIDSGLFSTPCGIVTQDSIDDANKLLIGIGDLVANKKYGSKKFATLAGDYLMLIPQEVGRKLSLEVLFPDLASIQQQKAILDSLQSSLDVILAGDQEKGKKSPEEKVFATKLEIVKDSKTIDRIKNKYQKTRKDMHVCKNLRVKTIWKVEIENMKGGFEKVGSKMSNIWELFHGSRVSNLLSILKAGLIIPPASSPHCTGRLYGPGIYASDISTKALNYSFGAWGGKRDNNCFMFLLDMAMGKQYFPSRSNYMSTRYPVVGYDSTFAKQGQGGVYNNEMIVYKTSQVNIKYLIEFSN